MPLSRSSLLETLSSLAISFEIHEHPAVFSTKDVVQLPSPIPGQDTKNLFLRDDKRTTFVLVCVKADTRVNLKELGKNLGIKGITFGSPDEMEKLLGVTPGSVCLFALGNDSDHKVRGYLDLSIDIEQPMQNHPLENTATVVLLGKDLVRFCEHTGHPLVQIPIPARTEG
jgi:Ala-tRNA(Pro) deacylase